MVMPPYHKDNVSIIFQEAVILSANNSGNRANLIAKSRQEISQE